jgi:GH35 family endo-1,4-beta-xylanase
VDWAASQGLIVKGHPLFWSIDKCVPEWVKRYDYRKQMMFAEVRVRNLAARFKGRVKIWDAVNEPLWEPAFKNLAHRHWPHIEPIEDMAEYIEQVLRWVRDEDPDACCLINDYGLEQDKQELVAKDGTEVTAALQRRRFLKLVAELRRRGSPPDALGMQAHTGGWLDHQTQWAVYDELSQAGLPLHVTEFWAHTRGLAEQGQWSEEAIDRLQAEYVANYLTAAFGHPALEGFFFWGFGGVEWYEHSGHELRPVFHRVRDLLHKEWRTQVQTRTDKSGAVRFRGFFGQYALRHELSPGVRHGVPFRVDRQSAMPLTVAVSTGA